ncbi:hypothetical protein [Domibacillus aminovorans]|uniref:Uncharacterized protein n=1 Tax=Domibacillus aminovorans TaxID=29332 RepID=A0A177LD34_9BACI|nr:hypothetical protein [Domibacillus aminovorans]OAH63085.1 hypothetical protein AWH49_07010 [Domibacillus aminovorans]
MTENKSIGAAVSSLTGMRLRVVHSILHQINARDLIALKAKSQFSKEEMTPFFSAITAEANKRSEQMDAELQLDVFIALTKMLKLPAARLNEKEKVAARSDEIVHKWFEKAAKQDKLLTEKFDQSLITDKLEFLLHYESVKRVERVLKNEKVDEKKEPLQEKIRRYWEEMPEYKRVQIYEHLHLNRGTLFSEILEEKGLASFLFEMGTRSGLSMYEALLSDIRTDVPKGDPRYLWVLHPDALFTTDVALKSLVLGSWMLPSALLLMYMSPEDDLKETDLAVIAAEWVRRESSYQLLIRQINELKVDQQETEKHIESVRLELGKAMSAEERARSVYRNLRERLIAILKTDPARPYLGDISVSNTRIREKLSRVQSKMKSNETKKGLLQSVGAWVSNTYWQTEKNSLEKKLHVSFEKMADEIMRKYPYYETDLISEMNTAFITANQWQFEKERLQKKEAESVKSLSEMKSEELKLREKAAESASKTPGLKQLGAVDIHVESPII